MFAKFPPLVYNKKPCIVIRARNYSNNYDSWIHNIWTIEAKIVQYKMGNHKHCLSW